MPSVKEQSTVDLIARIFCGEGNRNKTQTLVLAGYKQGYANGRGHVPVFGNVRVIKAIAKLDDQTRAESIANRQQRQEFWSRMMQNAQHDPDKLRASELLGRSEADFIERSINLNADIPTDPIQYRAWLRSELTRLEEGDGIAEDYDKAGTALAQRH